VDGLADCQQAIRLGRVDGVPIYVYLAEAEYRLGAWDAAATHGEVAATLVADMHEGWFAGLAHGVAALVPAGRGEWEAARAHVVAASASARPRGEVSQVFAANAAVHLAFARQDWPEVVAAGSRLREPSCADPGG
jgi:hypothetical protein